jgi:hypothetical protein
MGAIEAKDTLEIMIAYGLQVMLLPQGYYITRVECIEIIESTD